MSDKEPEYPCLPENLFEFSSLRERLHCTQWINSEQRSTRDYVEQCIMVFDSLIDPEKREKVKVEELLAGLPEELSSKMVAEVITPLKELSTADLDTLHRYFKKMDEWSQWNRRQSIQPKIIYRNLTEEMILSNFNIHDIYSVRDIAATLGLSTVNTKRNIIPFLIKKGFKIK